MKYIRRQTHAHIHGLTKTVQIITLATAMLLPNFLNERRTPPPMNNQLSVQFVLIKEFKLLIRINSCLIFTRLLIYYNIELTTVCLLSRDHKKNKVISGYNFIYKIAP